MTLDMLFPCETGGISCEPGKWRGHRHGYVCDYCWSWFLRSLLAEHAGYKEAVEDFKREVRVYASETAQPKPASPLFKKFTRALTRVPASQRMGGPPEMLGEPKPEPYG